MADFGFGGSLGAQADDPIAAPKRQRKVRRLTRDILKDIRHDRVPPPPKDPIKRLGWADKHYGTLPTNVIRTVADAALPDQDTIGTLNYLEREYDLPLNAQGWQRKGNKFINPRGKMVTGEQAFRVLKVQQDKQLRQLMGMSADKVALHDEVALLRANDPDMTLEQARKIADRNQGASVKSVANILEGMRVGLPKDQLEGLSAQELIGYASQAANNLGSKAAREAYVHTLNILRDEHMPLFTRHMYALEAGKAKWKAPNAMVLFADTEHVNLGIVVPNQELDNTTPEQFREQNNLTGGYWAMRQDKDGGMWFYFPADQKWHSTAETAGNESILLASYYDNTGSQPPVFESDPNKWEAPTEVNFHTINGDARVQVQSASLLPSLYSPAKATELSKDLYQRSIQIAERARISEEAFKNSAAGKLFGGVGKMFEEAYKFGGATVISLGGGFKRIFGDEAGQHTAQSAAYEVATGQKNITQALKSKGMDGNMAAGIDIVTGLLADPTVWAGAGVNTLRSGISIAGWEGKFGSASVANLGKRGVASRAIGEFSPLSLIKDPGKAIMHPFSTASNLRTWTYFQTQGRLLSIPKVGLKWTDDKGIARWGIRNPDDVAGMTRSVMMDQLTKHKHLPLGNKTIQKAVTEQAIKRSSVAGDVTLAADQARTPGRVIAGSATDVRPGRDLYAWGSEKFRNLYSRDPFTPQVASSIQRVTDVALAVGKSPDEIEDLVGQVLLSVYGIKPLDPIVLDNLIYRRTTIAPGTKSQLTGPVRSVLPDVAGYNTKWAREQLSQAASIFHFSDNGLIGIGLLNEVPRVSLVKPGLAQVAKILPENVRDALVRLKNTVPDSQIPGEAGGFEKWAKQTAIRSAVWSKTDVEDWAVKFREASAPFKPNRTQSMVKVANEFHRATFDKIASKYGADAATKETMWQGIKATYDRQLVTNARAFGEKWAPDADGNMTWQPIDDAPILESQEVNYLPAIDPLWMKHYVRDQLDAMDGLRVFFRGPEWRRTLRPKVFKALDPEYYDSPKRIDFIDAGKLSATESGKWDDLAAIYYNTGQVDTIDEFYEMAVGADYGELAERVGRTEDLVKFLPPSSFKGAPDQTLQGILYKMDKVNSTWKALQVVRPGYVPRIILDESIRSMSDLGIMSRVWASGSMRSIDKLTGGRLGFYDDPLDIPTQDGGFTTLNRKRPLQQTIEPYVNTGKPDWDDIYGSMFQKQWDIRSGEAFPTEWAIIEPGTKGHTAAWVRSLDEARNSVPGQEILNGVADGLERDVIARRLEQYLRTNKQGQLWVNARAMDPDSLAEYADTVTENVYRWTNGDAGIARAALDDVPELRKLLEAVETKPVVHGENLIDGGRIKDAPRKMLDSYKRSILQTPTNKLSRQPFFRGWYQRMYDGQWDMIRASGVVPKNADEVHRLDAYIKARARSFAIERTNRVMFSLSEQGRWAEMIRFAVPFAQPWAEAFTVYSHLLRKNPAMVAWARASFKAAEESGLIRHNEETGELEMNLQHVRYAAPFLMAASGNWAGAAALIGAGELAENMAATDFEGKDKFELYAPVSAFNMFLSGAIPADAIGLGSIAGDMKIPVPGLNPAVMGLLQWAHPETPGDGLSEWLYQYGSVIKGGIVGTVVGLTPRWMQNLMKATGSDMDPNERLRYVHRFLELGQMTHATDNMTAEQAEQWAQEQADGLYAYKAWLSLTSPAAPTLQWPTHELETEWRSLLESDQYKDDYSGALKEWTKRHPDMWMIPQAMSFWSETGKSELSTMRITPTLAQDMISADPALAEMFERYPEVAALMMPAAAQRSEDYNMDIYAKQIATNKRTMYTGVEAIKEGRESAYWAQAASALEGFTAAVEAKDLTYTDPEYITLKAERDKKIAALSDKYKVYDHVFDADQGVDPRVILLTRKMAADPQMAQFPFGKANAKFWALHQATEKQLSVLNVTQIESEAAVDIKTQYDADIADIIKETPEFGPYYQRFFEGRDLMTVETQHQKDVKSHPDKTFLFEATTQLKDAREAIGLGTSDIERGFGYLNRAKTVDAIYRESAARGLTDEQNPVVMDFKGRPASEQRIKVVATVSKSYLFLDRFEREYILGEVTSDGAEAKWLKIAEARANIAQQSATVQGFSTSAAYGQLNAQIAEYARTDPTFAAQVEHANTWGYGFFKQAGTIMTQGGRGQAAWEALKDGAAEYQRVVEAAGIHGTSYDKPRYNALRQEFIDDVADLREWSSTFDQQWEYYENGVGAQSDLTDAFFPPMWFRLGG
jgi:hypothetical protein